jgi:lipopolysaccharide/colanic/teichoic acid biosynthesis glycosyltransferase
MTTGDRFKRVIDVVVVLCALAVLGPLVMVPVAAAVALTSAGPVLYRHQRLGRGGRPFLIYKFRTMVVDAPDLRNPDGSTYSGADDPRLTRIGRFLRRTSLDELPQLFNVLRGEMSLVGPRPDVVDQLGYYTEEERRKLLVLPGLTGLAQISGRNSLSWEERKRLDVEYVDRRCPRLDLSILIRTIPYVLSGRGVRGPNGAP